jgi:ketosteroid isomerase-like protein
MPLSAREVFDRLITGISESRWQDLADLYAEDAVVDQPFMVPEPGRIHGREQVRAHFLAAVGLPLELRARNVVVHETGDPEVVIAEFDYDVRNTATRRESTVANVQVLRVRDGLIVATRDYHDHLRLAATSGAAAALAATLD